MRRFRLQQVCSPLIAQQVDDLFDALHLSFVTDEQAVAGVDHDQVLYADHGDNLFVTVDDILNAINGQDATVDDIVCRFVRF